MNYTHDDIMSQFTDTTEGLHGFKWQHYDMVNELRGNAAVEASAQADFRFRAIFDQQERILLDLMNCLAPLMGPSEHTGREAGAAYLEHIGRQTAADAPQVVTEATPELIADAARWRIYRQMVFTKPTALGLAIAPCEDGAKLDEAVDRLRAAGI